MPSPSYPRPHALAQSPFPACAACSSGEVFAGCRDGVRSLEEDVMVGRWSLWAKQGVHTLFPRYNEIDAEIGFVLQGTEDDEL